MKKMLTLIILGVLTTSSLTAQNYSKGGLTLKNNSQIDGRIAINYTSQTVVVKKDYKTTTYRFDQIASANLNNRTLNKIQIGDIPYFAAPLEDGNASLYQINESQYLVTTITGKSEVIDIENDRARIPGVLAVLFSDCNSIRRSLNSIDKYKESTLLNKVKAYNKCDYESYAPTSAEIDSASSFNTDQAHFYIGVGAGLSSISFFDGNESESLISTQLQLGVVATPGFLGNLQGNIYFTAEGSAAVAGDKRFNNAPNAVNFQVNSYRVLVGLEYQFNKEEAFKPFIGVSGGVTGDYYEGSASGNSFDISGGQGIFVPKIGARYQLNNGSYLGATLGYITGYENDLTFPSGEEIIPLIINVEVFTFGLSYYF